MCKRAFTRRHCSRCVVAAGKRPRVEASTRLGSRGLSLSKSWGRIHGRRGTGLRLAPSESGKPLPRVSRGGFRGARGGRGPPFRLGLGFSGTMSSNGTWTFTNPRIPDDETLTKTFNLHNFYLHFQRFEGPRFQNFPGGACPRTSLAYECLHVCYKPPLQNAHRSRCVNQEI